MRTTIRERDIDRYLARERQFCTQCFAAGKGWVRVSNMADRRTMTVKAYRAKRRRLLTAHLTAEHPTIKF